MIAITTSSSIRVNPDRWRFLANMRLHMRAPWGERDEVRTDTNMFPYRPAGEPCQGCQRGLSKDFGKSGQTVFSRIPTVKSSSRPAVLFVAGLAGLLAAVPVRTTDLWKHLAAGR